MRQVSVLTDPKARAARLGFTLVEILVVVAIVGILAALLLPAIGRVRESANQAKCVSNLKTLSAALLIAAGENNGILPMAYDQKQPLDDERWWMSKLSNTVGRWSTSVANGGQPNSSIYNCPTTKRKGTGSWPATAPCYGVNISIMGVVYVAAANSSSSKSLAALSRLSTLALIGDVGGPKGIMDGDCRMNAEKFVKDGFPSGMSTLSSQFPAPRHPSPRNSNYAAGALNVAFCDGHVETIKATDTRLSTEEKRGELFVP